MAICFRSVLSNTKQMLTHIKNQQATVPKGHLPVYVGDQADKKRYVVPISYLNHPAFQDLLHQAEQGFGFDHPMAGLTIPCSEETFFRLTSKVNC